MNIITKPFRYQYSKVVFWLIGINIFIFAVYSLFGRNIEYLMTKYLCMIPEYIVKRGFIWTFFTYMFMHAGITHILFNMLGLFIFGMQVERQMGSREFLLFYFSTGILAGIFSFLIYLITGADVILLGASGAIFAVQLAFAVFFPRSIIYIWGIIPLRAPIMVLIFTAISLFSTLRATSDGVAHITHLAGFGFAWLYFMARLRINPWRRLTGRDTFY